MLPLISIVHNPIHGQRSPIFEDASEPLLWAIRQRGGQVEERLGSFRDGGKHIVLGPNFLTWNQLVPPPESVLWNMEQLVEDTPWVREDVLRPYYRYPVWNYALAVEPRLKARGIPSTYVPIGWCPAWEQVVRAEKQRVDVCLFGWGFPRRDAVLQGCRDLGLQVYFHQSCFGEARKKICAQSKMMINIHTWDNGPVFESLRVGWALANGLIVVSESTPGPDEDRLRGAPGLFCVPYHALAATCRAIAARPRDERDALGEANRRFMRSLPQTLPEVF